MATPKAKMSFSQCRKAMLDKITEIQKNDMQKMTIQFQNEDVPEFLDKLENFEKESLKACLMVK